MAFEFVNGKLLASGQVIEPGRVSSNVKSISSGKKYIPLHLRPPVSKTCRYTSAIDREKAWERIRNCGSYVKEYLEKVGVLKNEYR